MYVIYEKIYSKRLENYIIDERNIGDSDSVNGIIEKLKKYDKIDIAKRTIYNSIKTKKPIHNRYYIYNIKEKVHDTK